MLSFVLDVRRQFSLFISFCNQQFYLHVQGNSLFSPVILRHTSKNKVKVDECFPLWSGARDNASNDTKISSVVSDSNRNVCDIRYTDGLRTPFTFQGFGRQRKQVDVSLRIHLNISSLPAGWPNK